MFNISIILLLWFYYSIMSLFGSVNTSIFRLSVLVTHNQFIQLEPKFEKRTTVILIVLAD